MSSRSDIKNILIDVSEQPAGNPKKEPTQLQRKEKNASCKKFQIVIDVEAGGIFSSDFFDGRTHDFRLFKESGAVLPPHVLIADTGCQGIAKIHKNSRTPFKRKKNCPLSEGEKPANRALSKQRITVEHI